VPLPLLFLRGGRYDGSNRRVFVSALFAPDCGSTCHDYTEQTIWDGDQVLGKIRSAVGGFQQSGTVADTQRRTGMGALSSLGAPMICAANL
jgi:hypothetical protein